MKRVIILFLSFVLMFTMVGCNASDGNASETTANIAAETTQAQTEEPKPHTEHDVVKGKCSVCGLDYYDELVALIKANATSTSPNYLYETYVGDLKINILYITEEDSIDIYCLMLGSESGQNGKRDLRITGLDIDRGSVRTGLYDWESSFSSIKGVNGDISGTMEAIDISKNLNSMKYDNSTFTSDVNAAKEAEVAADLFKKMLCEALPELLAKSEHNITMEHFGFERL